MSTEANKAVARRYVDEYLNQGQGVGGDDLFSLNYRCHFPGNMVLDKKEHDHITITFFAAFPDGRFSVEDMIAEGDRVVSRYTFRGTHQGVWITGTPPTGKQVTLSGNEIHRIVDGKVVEQWSEFDTLSALQQFGVIPAPGQ
jgi:predicted ester cyclase